MVAVVRLLMLLLLMMMRMGMLLMMLGCPYGPVHSFTGAPVQPPIPGVTRSACAAVASSPVNESWRSGGSRVEGAGGHREALMLIQRMVVVMQMMMVVVVSRFRRRISAGARSVTNRVFHKRVHVVHAGRRHGGAEQRIKGSARSRSPQMKLTEMSWREHQKLEQFHLKSVSKSKWEGVK